MLPTIFRKRLCAPVPKILRESDGRDNVILYLTKEKQKKHLPASRSVYANEELLSTLRALLGEENVVVV
jgi:DNA polymerase-3 subunit alpha